MCFPMALVKDAAFLGHGDHLGTGLGEAAADVCSSAGMFWQVEQMEMMKVIALARCGRRWSGSP